MVRSDIMQKLRRYCAYQERCHEEVRTKLLSLKVYGRELEEAISQLLAEDFLNEERFAMAYAGGKFRMQKWGKEKIKAGLKARKVSEYCINKALKGIPDTGYKESLNKLIQSAMKRYKSNSLIITERKTAQYLIAKGYETELVWQHIKKFTS